MSKKIFIIYSREDAHEIRNLKNFLMPLQKEGEIEIWLDEFILPGESWNDIIINKIRTSEIVLLCLSNAFFTSNYIENTELSLAFEKHDAGEMTIVPILIKPCLWDVNKKISKFQLLPTNGKAISTWQNADEAYEHVARSIQHLVLRDTNSNKKDKNLKLDQQHTATKSIETKERSSPNSNNKSVRVKAADLRGAHDSNMNTIGGDFFRDLFGI